MIFFVKRLFFFYCNYAKFRPEFSFLPDLSFARAKHSLHSSLQTKSARQSWGCVAPPEVPSQSEAFASLILDRACSIKSVLR